VFCCLGCAEYTVRHVPRRHLSNSRGSSMKPTAIFAIPSQFAVIEVDDCGHVKSSELSRCAEGLCVYSKANSSTNVLQQQFTVQTTMSYLKKLLLLARRLSLHSTPSGAHQQDHFSMLQSSHRPRASPNPSVPLSSSAACRQSFF